MTTIPYTPLIEHDDFVAGDTALRLGCMMALYKIFNKRLYAKDYTKKLYILTELPNVTFYKHRAAIERILKDILPETLRIKHKYDEASALRGNGQTKRARTRRLTQSENLLREEAAENPAPLMPQLSQESAKLNKQRISTQHVFSNPLPAKKNSQVKPPALTEKTTTS